MRPTHRSKLLVPKGNLDDLALLHCEWTLGLDRFAALRDARLALGVPDDARPADLVGEHGDRWLFRFALPTEHGMRTSAVRVSATDNGVLVEHLVVDEVQRGYSEPAADAPETTRVILDMPGVQPAMLRSVVPAALGERDVPALIADILDPRREGPIVLVSVDNATREPLVSPQELARRLAGMARVVWLSTIGASRRLKDELVARGFSEKFGCFHGGVRILWPGIQRDDNPYDHLLILPVRLYTIHERVRTERIAGLFCEMIAEDEDLRGRLREVEAPQRPEPVRRPAPPPIDRWSPRSSTAPTSLAPSMREDPPIVALPAPSGSTQARPPSPPVPELPVSPPSLPATASTGSGNIVNTPSAVDASSQPTKPDLAAPRPREKQTTWSRLASDVVAAAELAEELEDDLEALRRELLDSRKAQRRAEQERDEAVEARFTTRTVLEALTLAEACFPDRLVVLPSARASADSSPFRDPARIFESLSLLAFFGRHDGDFEAILQKVMGVQARWRSKDSPETTARFGAQRTWAGRDGTRKLFRRHITVGHGVDAQRCAQIYYDIASDGLVELAWVGEHRPTISEDA